MSIGENLFANVNLTLNSDETIKIGNNAFIGPNVTIVTANHPLNADDRNRGVFYPAPVQIGDNVWIGAGAIILPGVTLGDNVVVAAGAVVTKSFEENAIVLGGVPAQVIKKL